VTARDASDSRKATTSARSPGFTQREASASGMSRRLAGVSMMLGRMALTVTPTSLHSSAKASVSRCTPAFDAA